MIKRVFYSYSATINLRHLNSDLDNYKLQVGGTVEAEDEEEARELVIFEIMEKTMPAVPAHTGRTGYKFVPREMTLRLSLASDNAWSR